MKLTAPEKKLCAWAAKNQIDFGWQELKFGGRRIVISVWDRRQFDTLTAKASRLKNVDVTTWRCPDYKVFEAAIYLADKEIITKERELAKIEYERNNNWCQIYHDERVKGKSDLEAAAIAESLYPTPAA